MNDMKDVKDVMCQLCHFSHSFILIIISLKFEFFL